MSNSSNYSLRPEAGPIPYWKHHKRAKEAIHLIIEALNAATESLQGGKPIGSDSSIDTNRASRIFFVSGEPGSGKSTLYLTLMAMLNMEEEYYEGYKPKDNLTNLKNVQWLDALDLEVAGDEGENLLAAVLVRLFRKLEVGESNPILSKECEEAIKELEELATDIGIAWEGNLQARAGELDPDTYSTEVIRTQGARLGINKRLKEALDKFAKHNCYGCNEKTLFVLPVDDFYLKPAASLQLLRLLRMISIPRLFFLVMGDINTVEALFIEKSLADWTEVAGTRLFAARTDRLDEALTRARELRARYLRKLLPPLQRAGIEAMDWFEALDFAPSHPNASVSTLEELLEKVGLDNPLTGSGASNETLHTFLISPKLPRPTSDEGRSEKQKREKRAKGKANDEEKETKEKKEKEEFNLRKVQSAYTALQIMDATPREIVDLWSALNDVRRKREEFKDDSNKAEDTDKIPLLLLSVRDIVNLVREEQSFLNDKEQKVIEGILPTRRYSPEDINFAMDRLCLTPTQRNWKKPEEGSWQLWFREHRSWDLGVNNEFATDSHKRTDSNEDADEGLQQPSKDPFAKLPPRQAAWFVLLHDLAWEWNHDSVTGNLVKKLCEDLSEWELEDTGVDPPSKQPKQRFRPKQKQKPDPSKSFSGWSVFLSVESNYKHFPMPQFETFRDLDRFLFIWSSGLKSLKSGESSVNKIVSIWALAGWIVLAEAYEKFANEYKGDESSKWFKDFLETTGSLNKRFTALERKLRSGGVRFDDPSHKDPKFSNWLTKLDNLPKQFILKKKRKQNR